MPADAFLRRSSSTIALRSFTRSNFLVFSSLLFFDAGEFVTRMPRWFSVIALAAVLVIVLHSLVSFYQPTLAPWGRPPADIIKSPGNPIDEGKHLKIPESYEHQPPVEENKHTPEKTHTEHVVEEVEDLGPKGHEILLIVGSNGKSRSNIEGMDDMVRENRLQYVELHGNYPTRAPIDVADKANCRL